MVAASDSYPGLQAVLQQCFGGVVSLQSIALLQFRLISALSAEMDGLGWCEDLQRGLTIQASSRCVVYAC